MAFESPAFCHTFTAGSTFPAYYLVELSTADGSVSACGAVTDYPIGIAQEAADSTGIGINVLMLGISKISSDAALTVGAFYGPSADGQGVVKAVNSSANDGEYICGKVLQASGAANELATVSFCGNPWMTVIGASS